MIWGKPATVTGWPGPVGYGDVRLCRPGKLRDHRADIKHSLVDPVQLPHMPNRGRCVAVYLCADMYVANGGDEHQLNLCR